MNGRSFAARALVEIVLRISVLDAMQEFCEEAIDLQVRHRFDEQGTTFFRISEGLGGHTMSLALMPHDWRSNAEGISSSEDEPMSTTLHHLALTIPPDEYQDELDAHAF